MLRSILAATVALSLLSMSAQAATTSSLMTQPSINPFVSQFSNTLSDSCIAPEAGSFANDMLSFGINIGRTDQGCEIRKEAKILYDFGYPGAGMRVLCTVPRIALAMTAAGTPCDTITSSMATKPVVVVVAPTSATIELHRPETVMPRGGPLR